MKIVFLVNGLGEYSQAYAVARRLTERTEEVEFIATKTLLRTLITSDNFRLNEANTDDSVRQIISTIKADALFLCNSHTTQIFQLTKPKNISRIFSLDSNWLFNNAFYGKLDNKFLTYPWIDIIYAVFPKNVFASNLVENGGHYRISEEFKDKIVTPGFIPSGKKLRLQDKIKIRHSLGISPEDKLILLYFSRKEFHSSQINEYMNSLVDKIFFLVQQLPKEISEKIKVIDLVSKKSNFAANFPQEILTTDTFDTFVSSADLVLMHYGYGTLPKLFHNQIPVISFFSKPTNQYHSSQYELTPCINAKVLMYNVIEEIKDSQIRDQLLSLLFDVSKRKTMQEKQNRFFLSGENALIEHFYMQYN